MKEGNDTRTVNRGKQTVELSEGDQEVTVRAGKQAITVNGDHTRTVQTENVTIKGVQVSVEAQAPAAPKGAMVSIA